MNDPTKIPTVGGQELVINLDDIYRYEMRKDEVATVTKLQAPELMTALEKGYSRAAKAYAMLLMEATKAKEAMEFREAQVQLEVVPEYEKDHGKQTEAQRKALIKVDPEYRRLHAIHDQLVGLKEYLKGKCEGFQMSFSAVKRVYDSLSKYGMDTQQENLGFSKREMNGEDTASKVGKPRY